SVAEHRGHLDRGVLPHHRAGLRDRALARIELDLDELELLPLDLEVDIVGDARRAMMLPWAVRCHYVPSLFVLLRKQEPRAKSDPARNPRLLLSQEHNPVPPPRSAVQNRVRPARPARSC